MSFNPERINWDFVTHRRKYYLASASIILLGIIFLALAGFNLGVDFDSGTQLEILIGSQPFPAAELQTDILEQVEEAGYVPGEIRFAGAENETVYLLYSEALDQEEIIEVREAVRAMYGEIEMSEATVSPDYARELAFKAIVTLLIALVAVILYVTFRFEYRFAIAAIIGLLHDALLIVAVFAVLRLEVDLTFIAAVLTIIGYSINDTIVLFDRIRENMKVLKLKNVDDLSNLVNRSIIETLPRTINTTVTVIVVAAMLFFFGSEGIRNFSFALLVGLTAGAYSTTFIAAQVWVGWKARDMKKSIVNSGQEM